MRIGITYRLFLLILGATGLAILCLFLITWWSINRGFFHYIGVIDQKRMEQLAVDMGKHYEEQGNWDFLSQPPPDDNRRAPMPFPEQRGDISPSFSPHQQEPGAPARERFPGMHPSNGRFVVLDADKKPLRGIVARNEKDIPLYRIVAQGKTVGYVGLRSPRNFLYPTQVQFLSEQKLALAMGAGGMVLVVILVSLPLARRMVKPIKAMASATHDIASGQYATRISFRSTDELGQLADDFNAMAQTLEKHDKERRQWIADISHELRTPISILQGEIEALLDGIRRIDSDTIRSLHAETLRLKRLVEDLYQLSISDLHALTCRKEMTDLRGVLMDSVDSYRESFDRKGIALHTTLSEEIKIPCIADRERLNQLFKNLLENSLRYTDAGGRLEIETELRQDAVQVEFRDSKPGVSEENMEKLFERFYRVEGSRNRRSGGAGLGLAICREIVRAHDGAISAHPSPLGGLLIRISLPISG
jgi:two-component system sensor histidine kinase BaeS